MVHIVRSSGENGGDSGCGNKKLNLSFFKNYNQKKVYNMIEKVNKQWII